jgi:hypothetical protein
MTDLPKICKKHGKPKIYRRNKTLSDGCVDCIKETQQRAKERQISLKKSLVDRNIESRNKLNIRLVSAFKKKTSKKSLIKELDTLFSYFVRQRDADENGYIRCISCGGFRKWKYSDCGHFISRNHKALRFNEQNCNAQCKNCNGRLKGNLLEYRKGLIIKIGLKAVESLEMRKNNKFDKSVIPTLILLYQKKLKSLNYEFPKTISKN